MAENAGYTINSYSWNEVDGAVISGAVSPVEVKRYRINIELVADTGYTFRSGGNWTVNGELVENKFNNDKAYINGGKLTVCKTFSLRTPLDRLEITIGEPVDGTRADLTPVTSAEPDKYIVGIRDVTTHGSGINYKAGFRYDLSIYVVATDAYGYFFRDETVFTQNGEACQVFCEESYAVIYKSYDLGAWYAMDGYGYMLSNAWFAYKEDVYRLGGDGVMLTSQWVHDGYGWSYVNEDGIVPFESWVKDSGGTCYIGSGGYMLKNSWIGIDGKKYYVDENGHMLRNTTRSIESKYYPYLRTTYKFDSNGVATEYMAW